MTENAFPVECEALLLDFDGTLVDTFHHIHDEWNRWAALHSLDPADVIAAAQSQHFNIGPTVSLLMPDLDDDALGALVEQRRNMSANANRSDASYPGARDLLERLPLDRWAIVTGSWRSLLQTDLALSRLPEPKVSVTADDSREAKPSPWPYLHAAKLLGVDITKCVVVEDTPGGITSGNEAGAFTIGLRTTFPESHLQHADAIIDTIADLVVEVLDDGLRVSSKG